MKTWQYPPPKKYSTYYTKAGLMRYRVTDVREDVLDCAIQYCTGDSDFIQGIKINRFLFLLEKIGVRHREDF